MKKIIKENKNSIISFILAFIILLVALAINDIEPIGNKSILTIDLDGQYIDFFAYLKTNLNGFYSFNGTLGNNMIGIFAYYLISPLNILLFIFPLKYITFCTSLIMILKVSLSALTFSYMLEKKYKRKDIYVIIFSLLYALNSFNVTYIFNLMWLDSLYLLPLIVLGIDKYLKKDEILLYMISFFLCILSNYYMGYIITLYIIIYYLMNVKYDKNFIKKSIRFLLYSLLTIGLLSVILLPTYFSLKTGKIDNINIFNFEHIITFTDTFNSVSFLKIPTELTELNIYCGIFGMISLVYFIINKNNTKQEKIKLIIFLLIFAISFSFRFFNYVWHAFNKPQWFSYRNAFLFSFTLLLYVFKNIDNLHKENKITKILLLILSLLLFVVITFSLPLKIKVLSFVFVILYILLNNYKKIYIFSLIIIELMISTTCLINNSFRNSKSKDNYYNYIKNNKEVLKEITDKDFYRIEKTYKRSFNDSLALNYNGVEHFSSIFYKQTLELFNSLGFKQYFYKVDYHGNTDITNDLFGIKYIISNKEINDYDLYKKVNEKNIYLNEDTFSILFESKSNLIDLKLTDNVFENQNNIINEILHTNNKYFKEAIFEIKNTENCTIEEQDNNIILKSDNKGKITLTFDKPVYLYIKTNDIYYGDYLIINGKKIKYFDYENDNYIINLNDYNSNEVIIEFIDELIINDIQSYSFDKKTYQNDIKQLNKLNVINEKNQLISEVNLEKDTYIISTIPYDKGWNLYIDGEKANTDKLLDSLLSFKLSKGNHKIKLKYIPKGLIEGLLLSLGSLSLIIILCFKNTIRKILKKYKELITYGIFGILTTLINLISFYLLDKLEVDLYLNNTISWVLSVVFAYITNKIYVFNQTDKDHIFKEFLSFISSRLLTYFIDMFLMFLLIDKIKFNNLLSKVIVNIIVIIINYLFSKLFVFKKK